MKYVGKLMILSLASFSAYSILLTVLYLSLACLLGDVKMLTACQSLYGRSIRDSVPKQEEDSNAGALYFFNTKVGL